jgi:CxxC motif-containing protein (DUF1111 family)
MCHGVYFANKTRLRVEVEKLEHLMLMLRRVPLLLLAVCGCGALFSDPPAADQSFDGPIEGLTRPQLATFLLGDEAFGFVFAAENGLGPIFNQSACTSCHPNDGKGHPSANLVRFGKGDASDAAEFDYMIEWGGPQLQDHAIAGYQPETLPEGATAISARSGPLAVGLGLIEALPDSAILAHADPDDENDDGIRGVPNYVLPPEFVPTGNRYVTEGKVIGRFGRKATAVTLLHQAAAAYLNDMGITSDFFGEDLFNPLVGGPSGDLAADPEVSSDLVHNVVFYLQTLRPPLRRNTDAPEVQQGDALFTTVGCSSCHVPSMKTGSHPIAALSQKTIELYSDLLLHDMGDKLADNYPEGSATGAQWRTTPLWGLGIVQNQLGGDAHYLHDGRARSLTEAIELHGGESQASRDAFLALTDEDQRALLAFLRSL